MNKFKDMLYGIIGGALIGGFAYIMSGNIYFPIVAFFLTFVSISIFIIPMIEEYLRRGRLRHECYKFVNSFLISLSITGSLDKGYDAAVSESDGELKRIIDSIESKDIKSRIFYLSSYFDLDQYSMFLSLFSIYESQGGDLFAISKPLLDELTRIEESERAMSKDSLINLKEFLTMWILAIVIMAFLRFGLANFYESLRKSVLFLSSVAIFIVFFLFSSIFYTYQFSGKINPFRKKRKKA